MHINKIINKYFYLLILITLFAYETKAAAVSTSTPKGKMTEIEANPLLFASMVGNIDEVQKLLEAGEDPNQVTPRFHNTAMEVAAQNGRT